jgi:hypothetical protein
MKAALPGFKTGYTRTNPHTGEVVLIPSYLVSPQSTSPQEHPSTPSRPSHLPSPETPPVSGDTLRAVREFVAKLEKRLGKRGAFGLIRLISLGVKRYGKAHVVTRRGRGRKHFKDILGNQVILEEARRKSVEATNLLERLKLIDRIREIFRGGRQEVYQTMMYRTALSPDMVLKLSPTKLLYIRYWIDKRGLLGKKGFMYMTFCIGHLEDPHPRRVGLRNRIGPISRIIEESDAFIFFRGVKKRKTRGRVYIEHFRLIPLV